MKLAERITAHPRACLFSLAVLLALILARMGTLGFDADINRTFYTDSPISQAQRQFEDRFETRLSDVVLLVEAPRKLSSDQLARARDLALDIELTPGVAAVVSPFALRFPPGHPDYADAPVIPVKASTEDITRRLAAFAALKTGLPTMVADDALLVVASVDTAERPLSQALAEIRGLASSLDNEGLTVTITGPDVMGLAISDGLKDDLMRLNVFGAVLVALLALAFLRNVRLAAAAILPALLGMAATLGLAAWLAIPITVLNNVIPMLILVIGVANGFHLAVHLAQAEGTIENRVADTLRAVGPASALTAGTTAIAFASIMWTSNEQLFDFALLGALAMAVAVVFLLVGFAAVATVLSPSRREIGGTLARISSALGTRSARKPRLVAMLGLLILIASGLGFATTTAWFPLGRYLPADSPLRDVESRIDERFNGIFRAWVEMPPSAGWPELSTAVRAVEETSPDGAVLSELALARWSGDAETPPTSAALDRLPKTVTERLTDPETGIRRFVVSVPEPMRSDDTLARFDAIETAALEAGAARVIGIPQILRRGSVDLIHELSIGLLLASVGGALVVALAFHSLRLLPVVLFVNLLPVLIVGAAPHALNAGHLTPPLTLALTIAFGIAVDDTVHLLTRYRQALKTGLSSHAALHKALTTAGGVMTMTTLLLGAGLAVTAISVFEPVRLFGATLVLSLIAALLTDLILLPALLTLGDRHASA